MHCQYDEVFAQIAGRAGGLGPFLDAFFSFLHRRTDFYIEFDQASISPSSPRPEMGFAKGVAEKMLLSSFQKYNMIPYKSPSVTSNPSTPVKAANDTTPPTPPSLKKATTPKHSPSNDQKNPTTPHQSTPHSPSGGSTPSTPMGSAITQETEVRFTEEGKMIPIGNGGIGGIKGGPSLYYWTQTLKDLTVYVDVPQDVRGKDVKCTIQPRKISLSVRGEVLLEGDLEESIRCDESMWTLNVDNNSSIARGGGQVVISLDKCKHTWWKHIIVGHIEIDTTKVDSSQKMSDYDEKTQATIRKIMFDQRQKAQGLPTSEELETEALLEKVKYLPGSPFLPQQPKCETDESQEHDHDQPPKSDVLLNEQNENAASLL